MDDYYNFVDRVVVERVVDIPALLEGDAELEMKEEITYEMMSDLWDKINPNPFKLLAKTNHCNLDLGDSLFVPKSWLDMFPELKKFKRTKNVHFQDDLDAAYTMKLTK